MTLLSLDDGFSPPKAFEQHRKLVEEEQVLALVNTIGTETNTAKDGDPLVSPTNYATYSTFRTQRFEGKRWVLFGEPIMVD